MLTSLPPEQCLNRITKSERVIHTGIIQTATITGAFTLSCLDANGQEIKPDSPAELILDTPQMQTWLTRQITESTWTLICGSGPVRVTQKATGMPDLNSLPSRGTCSCRKTLAVPKADP